MMQRLALMGGALLLCPLPLAADTFIAPPVEVLEYGVICDYRPQGQEIEAPDTNAGRIRQGGDPIVFDLLTDQVPGVLGVAFGISFQPSADLGDVAVRMVTHHPSFGTGFRTSESWPSTITGGSGSSRYFYFEFDYELAPGPWVMEVWLEDQLIVRQDFNVVSGEAAKEILRACPTENLTS